MTDGAATEKAKRRAYGELVGMYHRAELAKLLEHVRTGFAAYDASQIDAFELDELIHRYKCATIELWKFCGSTGSQIAMAGRTIELMTQEGEAIDWWERGAFGRLARSS